ncbi:MAG: hypothetical protein KDB71_13570 [Mycobacterium sp.]|nr:hypothetical protein [Mycobacterium sp.]
MGWNLTAALIVIAVASAAGGLLVSAIARQKKRRVRGPFLVGVVCGFMVGVALAGRRRGLNAVGASRMYAVNRQLRAWFGLATEGVVARALTVVADARSATSVIPYVIPYVSETSRRLISHRFRR